MKNYTTLDAIGDMFVIYGIVIVVSMLVALVIRGIVMVLSRQAEKEAAKAPAKPASAAAPQPILTGGVPQEHIAVITAAVAAMLGSHRVVHIETPDRGFGWTAEARSSHHTSHAPRASH